MLDGFLRPELVLFGEKMDPGIAIKHEYKMENGEIIVKQRILRTNPLFIKSHSQINLTKEAVEVEERELIKQRERELGQNQKEQDKNEEFMGEVVRYGLEADKFEYQNGQDQLGKEQEQEELLNQQYFGVALQNAITVDELQLRNINSSDSVKNNEEQEKQWKEAVSSKNRENQEKDEGEKEIEIVGNENEQNWEEQFQDELDIEGLEELEIEI